MGAYCLYTALSGGVKSAHRDSVTPRGLRATRSSPTEEIVSAPPDRTRP